jgi:hypothetical protein
VTHPFFDIGFPNPYATSFALLLESAMFMYPLYSHVSFISPYNVLHKQVSYGDNLKTHHLFSFVFSGCSPAWSLPIRISEVLVFWFVKFFTQPIGLGDLKSQRPFLYFNP